MVNNIYIAFTGHDTSERPKWRFDRFLRFFLRLTVATLPLLTAFGVSNLIFILRYAGLLGFSICFLYPTVLQLASTFVCMKEFSYKTQLNLSKREGESPLVEELDEKNRNTELGGGEEAKLSQTKEEKSPLLEEKPDNTHRLYMTPYSHVVVSNPIFVSVMAAIEVCLSVLAIASAFVAPHLLTCDTRVQ